jgi:hypothetical protein
MFECGGFRAQVRSVRLMTNNPRKIDLLTGARCARNECGPGGVQLAVGSRQQAVCNRQCAEQMQRLTYNVQRTTGSV